MIRFFTFSAFHNKHPIAGSTQIRVQQLIKYWPEAGNYKYGENPDCLIFQKVYVTPDYRFPLNFEKKKILDICDPDWMNGVTDIALTISGMDAVVCPTKNLQKFLQQLTDKPVVVIKDRFDIALIPNTCKVHKRPAKEVVWFGYSHNAEALRYALPLLEELNLKLTIIADDDPLIWRFHTRPHEEYYTYHKYEEETIYELLGKADMALLPKGDRPQDVFKSNNKKIKAILAGLPVAYDAKTIRKFVDADARNEYMMLHYVDTREEYDVRKSVEEYKELIASL